MKLQVDLKDYSYPIYIEHHALDHIHDFLPIHRKYAIVTDDGIPSQWIELLASQLPDAFVITFPHGEQNKSLKTYEWVMMQLIEAHMSRHDGIIALGGGVVGDLAGFVASTYMRGIDFYNIPTTILSQVDSSVGGKVAIDMGRYKNIVGAFYQPKAVIIDPETLSTLDCRQQQSGLMEALKMGLILEADLVDQFEKEELDLDHIIYRSIDLKRQIVENDEKEQGQRAVLNFGHSIGHALESHYQFVPYYHGECVAMGMLFFITDPALKERILAIYEKLDLPSVPAYDPDTILTYIKHDKKGSQDSIQVIEVEQAGSYTFKKRSYDEILALLKAGPYEK